MAEIFRSQVRIYGKHAQYVEALTPGNDSQKNAELPEIARNKYLFDTIVDIYILAPLVGYLYQRTSERDGSDQASSKSIMEGALASHHDKLEFSYELLMILDKKSEPDLNERIRRAFRATDDLVKQGMEIYNGYARGGIEILYEHLIEGAATPDDLVRNVIDFAEEWNEKFLTKAESGELDLDSLLKR